MLCKNFKNLLIIFILATTAGCSTSNYKSNKDPNFSGPVKNMALLEKMIPAPFNNSFNTNFISTINSCGTKVTQFSTPNITGKFDSILSIDTVSFSKNGYGVPLSYNYEFTLIDSRGQKVWKAQMTFNSDSVANVGQDRGKILASEVITHLNQDGILAGCVPPAA